MSITICEVGPRDGLQNLARIFSVEERAHMVTELAAAGLRQIEAVSMVNPARVPQMAGAEELLAALPPLPAVQLAALVLNRKGAERALVTRVTELRFAVVASDTFCRRNQNMGSDDSVAAFAAIAPMVGQAGRSLTGVIATAYGCPFEGEVAPSRVAHMAEALLAAGADRIVLADTIGVAAPRDIARVHEACCSVIGATPWGVHLHNTRNTGYANLMAALERGASIIDAAIGGLGGCPFAPRATGNIATEDVNYLLEREGIVTGLDHDRLAVLVEWLSERVPDKITGQLARAGWFGA
ncbi:hydroxymethylglutaryl-CoA lyase [Paracoccus gahaiensis]|uniref:Hydroxymethylglutaryl-CoA lyase n=1 Tax=Paracoccus gahaiensis TaxID=1706839 RepID=A0A4U0R5V5_9RHOB|nr:hydroxymethylglutaryl-CoA lyase [Paracoccus gahaiensis]TJZ90265.1 hydroxymethylglutaryl-CoA lyase [Paracoccus gahaiensis]